MTSSRTLILLLAGALVLTAILFVTLREGSDRSPRLSHEETNPAPVSALTGEEARSALGEPSEADPAKRSTTPEARVESRDENTFHVSGRVIEGRTGEPVEGAKVTLDAPDDYVEAATDASGRFAFDLRRDAWQIGEAYRALVTKPGNQRLFLGNVILEPELLLKARSLWGLRGRLVTNADVGMNSGIGVKVQAHVPPSGTVHVAVYAGNAPLEEDGSFEIEAWTEGEPEAFQLSFGGFQRFLVVQVPRKELVSEEGATIEYLFGELTVHVEDESGKPLPQAEVSILTEEADGWNSGESGSTFLVAAGNVELLAVHEGFTYAHADVVIGDDLAPVEHRLRLRPLEKEERITGTVLGPLGDPVAGAFVSAFPRGERGLYGRAHAGVESDENGAFELALGGGLAVELTASHKDLGKTPPLVLEPGERHAALRFRRKGGVSVDLVGVPSDQGAQADAVQWIVTSEEGNVVSSHDWSYPFLVDDLVVGPHEVHILLAGAELYGRAVFDVAAGERTTALVEMESAPFLDGHLTEADGSPAAGMELQLLGLDLPPEVITRWARATTAGDGRFRILLGPEGTGKAAVYDSDGNQIAILSLSVGSAGYVLR